jgi:predicted secreted protein
MNDGIGIHQLPCPEYRHLGLKREPMSKEQYDTKEFRDLCNSIAEDTINIMKEYLENDYQIVGLMGIHHSPTCSIKGRQGILMEEILDMGKKENISLNLIDVPGDYIDGKDNSKFIQELDEFLK